MRKAGILLPIFSLPSKYGIGSLGKEAYGFIDFLARCGQSVWQILPITSTSKKECYSPYKTSCAFSGNFDFIDIDLMVEDGFLCREFVDSVDTRSFDTDLRYVDYDKVRALKRIFFEEAYSRFDKDSKEFQKFQKENSSWLNDYCKYIEIETGEEFYYTAFLQFLFYKQWFALKAYANKNGVEIFGDMPIYVSEDSSDYYFNKEIFLTDKNGQPSAIAGVPPDEFSEDGQCWGNPLYDWKVLKKRKYSWWMDRIKKSMELYDIVRIDHFRAFESFYAIDRYDCDAKNGVWKVGPGKDFFKVLQSVVPKANIVAEDLGIITDEVRDLLEYTGLPGMKILQFGFGSDSNNLNLPHTYYKNTVAYTGTHDNKTLVEWLETANEGEMCYAKKYLRLETYDKYTEGFIRAVIGSPSDLAIIPIQDWLDFGRWARINTPSTVDINWKFRLLQGELSFELEKYISEITGIYGRYINR